MSGSPLGGGKVECSVRSKGSQAAAPDGRGGVGTNEVPLLRN